MAEISVRLSQINVSCDQHGRIEMDDDEKRHNREPRTPGLRAGTNNFAAGNILIFDAEGDGKVVTKADNDKVDNKGWDVKLIAGRNEVERIGTFVIGKVGDDKYDVSGDKVPFVGLREARDTKTHGNKMHFAFTGGKNGVAFFRQWVDTEKSGRVYSDWFGATDGKGLRFGAQ